MRNEAAEKLIKDVIIRAGSLLRCLTLGDGASVNVKDQPDDCDRMINKFIIENIREQFPSHNVISEQGPSDPLRESGFTWVIDPIDGSDNCERGILAYSISISLFHDNEIVLGSVFEPYVDRLFVAVKGLGATLNGRRLQVSPIANLDAAFVATSTYNSFVTTLPNGRSCFQRVVESANVRISASTALDMCYVASGGFEARIMADTKIWDNSAASLLVQEAGGRVTDWEGKERNYESPQLIASNGLCHDKILELLRTPSI